MVYFLIEHKRKERQGKLELKTCIRELAEKRGLSIEVMSLLLGYRSPTSLKRILHENVRPATLSDFVRRMEAHMDLSEGESSALDRAVRIRQYGLAWVRERDDFRAFLQGGSLPAPETLVVEDLEKGEFEPLIQRYSGKKELRLHAVNCVYPAFFSALRKLLAEEGSDAVQAIRASTHDHGSAYIMNMLCSVLRFQNYHGAILEATAGNGPYVRGPWEADVLLCSWQEPGVGETTELLTFRTPTRVAAVSLKREGVSLRRLLISLRPELRPLNRSWPAITTMEDYVSYLAELAELEKDAEIWEIKPDPCLVYIPAEVQRAALEEGPIPAEQLSPVLEALYKTAQARNRNIFTKRKATHTILKKGAMRQLALSGKTMDHFWGFRPYTKEERLRIFCLLLEQAQENRQVHLYFLREDDALRDVNVMLYGSRGILLCNMDTNYDLGGGHSDLLMTPPESFLEEFQRFFMTDLVKELCLSEGESIEYLTYLLNLVRESG